MLDLTLGRDIDDFFAAGNRRGKSRSFVADMREVSGERIKVFLAPFLERMMVAFGALESDAQKQLTGQRRHLIWAATVPIQRRGAILPGTAFGRDQCRTNRS